MQYSTFCRDKIHMFLSSLSYDLLYNLHVSIGYLRFFRRGGRAATVLLEYIHGLRYILNGSYTCSVLELSSRLGKIICNMAYVVLISSPRSCEVIYSHGLEVYQLYLFQNS